MSSHRMRRTVSLASALLYCAVAHGSTIYNESVSGDLSNNGLTPTSLAASAGLNDVFGTTGRTGSVIDRDYFTFTIAPGQQLSAITVLPGTAPLGALGFSFIGLQSGSQVTVSTAATDATGLLGWDHFSAGEIGTNILPLMGAAGMGSTGFTGPLPSGAYSFWVQDFNAGSVPYGFEFAITPEPSTWTMMLAGLGMLVAKTRSRAAQSRHTAGSENKH